jgi:hypothetical protein
MSTLVSPGRRSTWVRLPVVRRATASATSTTRGQPKPRSSRFEPVMFAAANWAYPGSVPERNA